MSQEDKPAIQPNEAGLSGALPYPDSKPVAAQEPVGEMVGHHRVGTGEMPTIRWRDGYWPTIGTQFYANAAPCARCKALEEAIAKERT